MESTPNFAPAIIPHLWYPDPRAAVSFLERAFGFHANLITPTEGESVYAELKVGRGRIWIGEAHHPKYMFRTPREAGGINTGAPYIGTREVDAVYRRAKDAGAEIARDLADTEYGSRDFSVRDPDGYLWNFGTYHPTVDDTPANEADVFDALKYERPRTAMNWLIRAFGFEEHYVAPGKGEEVPHALLRFENSLLMVSGTRLGDPLKMMPPQQLSDGHIGGIHTQVIHVVVKDPDAQFEKAKATDAEMEVLEDPADTARGGRQYLVRDPEGYMWCFASDRPASRREAVGQAAAEARVVGLKSS